MCSLIVFFPVAIATMVGIREVDRSLLEMSRAFRASRLQTLLRIEIPGALPSIFGGLRVGATLAVIGAVISEWAGADNGLGVLLLIAKGSRFDMPLALATLVTIAGARRGLLSRRRRRGAPTRRRPRLNAHRPEVP